MANKDTAEQLRLLDGRAAKLQAELTSLKDEQSYISRRTEQVRKQLSHIEEEKKKLKRYSGAITLTNHAIVRYTERVLGMSADDILQDLLDDKLVQQIKTLRTGRFAVPSRNVKLQVRDGAIITIIPIEEPDHP